MAVIDLDIDNLTMETLPDAYNKIVQGINDRITLIAAFSGYPNSASCSFEPPSDGVDNTTDGTFFDSYGPMNPWEGNLSNKMNFLLRSVYNMAHYFINLEDVDFHLSYTDFPHNGERSMRKGCDEHPLGVCVGKTRTFDEATMQEWKEMFRVAAYWLNKFTAILVPSRTRSTCQYTYRSSTPMDAPINASLPGQEMSNDPAIVLTYYYDFSYDEDEPRRTKTCSCTSGLTIINRSPWDGVCKVYLCNPSTSAWNSPKKWNCFDRDISLCTSTFTYEDNPRVGSEKIINETMVLTDNEEWNQMKDKVTEYTYSRNGGNNYQTEKTETQLEKNYTPDASDEIVIKDETESYGPDYGKVNTNYPGNTIYVYAYQWDGLGLCADIDTPLEETVPAHSKKRLDCFTFSQIPEPESVDFESYFGDEWQRGSYHWDEKVRVHYDLRVIPIMDFSDAITTYRISSDDPQEG